MLQNDAMGLSYQTQRHVAGIWVAPKGLGGSRFVSLYLTIITSFRSFDGKTPFQMYFDRMPNISKLTVFGCSHTLILCQNDGVEAGKQLTAWHDVWS